MIVDCHTHVWLASHWSDELKSEVTRARGRESDVESSWESHWEAVKAVDRAIVFGLHAKHVGLFVPNDFIADYVSQNPHKLLGFASVDPNDKNYLEELQRSIEDLKLCGLKIGPTYQNYHPMDDRMHPIYEYCQRNLLPIMIHQGTTFPRKARLKYADPLQLEDVALAYPDLKMIIAHLGHPWIAETIVLIRKHPNLYTDLSALVYRPWQLYNGLMLAVEYGVTDKLLFGSDYPFTTPAESAEGLKKINNVTGQGGLPQVPAEIINRILERDTLALLGLN